MKQTDQDELLANYLLGKVPEAEEVRLEAEYLADADAQERLAVLEDELVDAYVRRELSRLDCQRLEARFLASPRGRQKLALARSVLALAAKPSHTRRWGWLALSAAAAMAAAMLLGLLLRRSHSTLPLDTQRAAQTQQAPTPPAPVVEQPQTPPAPVIAFAVLKPGASRGGSVLEHVHIPAGASELKLELDLDADRHSSYRVELFGASEQVRWRARGLKSRRVSGGGRGILVQLPVSLFRDAEYTFVLSPDQASVPAIAEFGFVVKKD